VPVRQLSGKMDASLKILIKLDEKSLENFDEKSVIANGDFKISDAVLDIAGSKFNAKNALVKLVNTSALNIDASGFGLDFFRANAKADINLQKSIKEKNDEILAFKNEPFSALLDFSKPNETTFSIEPFGLNLSFGDESLIATKNSNFIMQNSPVLKQNGVLGFDDVSIKSKDFVNLEILAKGLKFDMPFLAEKGIEAKSNNLNLLVLDDNSTKEQSTPLELFAKNGDIILQDLNKTLPFTSFSAEKKGKSTSLNGLAKQGRVGYFSDGRN